MIAAAEEFFGHQVGFLGQFPDFNIKGSLPAPYLFWYYHRKPDGNPFESLSPMHQDLMRLLTGWIDENYGELYGRAEEQLKRGKVSYNTMEFLIRPGEVVVFKDKNSVSAAIAKSWPTPENTRELGSGYVAGHMGTDWTRDTHKTTKSTWKWSLNCWKYKYDGKFYKSNERIEVVLEAEDADSEIDIRELLTLPLQYADNWGDLLRIRGRTFWSCRYRRLVSYQDDRGLYSVRLQKSTPFKDSQSTADQLQNGDRFMIDFDAYTQLHSDSFGFKREYSSIDNPGCVHMDSSIMKRDEPPSGAEIHVFPRIIHGYNLRSKKWG